MQCRFRKLSSLIVAAAAVAPVTVTCQPGWGAFDAWYGGGVVVEDDVYYDGYYDGGYYVDTYDDGGGFWFDYWD